MSRGKERVSHVLTLNGSATCSAVTASGSSPAFDGRRYWRGPTWVNVNWMLIEGLRRAGDGAADRLADRTLELIDRVGFREYFDPRSGEGCGAEDFAWTAALALDLLA